MSPNPTLTAVICSYSLERWGDLARAVESLNQQSRQPDEVLVIVDHNDELLDRARKRFVDARVLPNVAQRGLSGARNTAVDTATSQVIAFLDDDAAADQRWAEELLLGYSKPVVLGVGGASVPRWDGGRPRWFPPEFDWVVGCSYRGMPDVDSAVRNLIGSNMSFRTDLLRRLGGFSPNLGRVGNRPDGCEETELCIRALLDRPDGVLLYRPTARVSHHVPRARSTRRYFVARCFAEGRSKALVLKHVGARMALKTERRYAARVLPRAVLSAVRAAFVNRAAADFERAAAIVLGFGLTSAGFLIGALVPAGTAD